MKTETIDLVVSVLSEEFCGVGNAAPIEVVVNDLILAGVNTSRRHFQLRIKPALLERGFVVGACQFGVFLCCKPEDYGQALQWYETRIASEQKAMSQIIEALVRYSAVNPS